MFDLVVLIIALILFAVGFPLFIAALLGMGVNLGRMALHLVSYSDSPIWIKYNPTNALFAPGLLDDKGKRARGQVFFWLRRLLVAMVLVIAASILSGQFPR